MGDLLWDLVFYGAMATIFIGIIVSSQAARRKQRESRDAAAAEARDDPGDSGSPGGS